MNSKFKRLGYLLLSDIYVENPICFAFPVASVSHSQRTFRSCDSFLSLEKTSTLGAM